MTAAIIEGLKLIRHNSRGINQPDDPSLPFRLEINCRPPEFMAMAFIGLHGGSEEVVVRAPDRAAIDRFIDLNDFRHHPRLRWMKITGPEGTEEIKPKGKA